MKIAANDPGLAHAASRASLGMACDALFEEVERDRAAILKAAKGKRAARNLLEGYRRTLGSRILWVRSKALSSTTRAAWTIAHVGAANRKLLGVVIDGLMVLRTWVDAA